MLNYSGIALHEMYIKTIYQLTIASENAPCILENREVMLFCEEAGSLLLSLLLLLLAIVPLNFIAFTFVARYQNFTITHSNAPTFSYYSSLNLIKLWLDLIKHSQSYSAVSFQRIFLRHSESF